MICDENVIKKHYKRYLEREVDRLKKTDLNANSKRFIFDGINLFKAQGLTDERILHILRIMCTFTSFYDGDITKLEKKKLIIALGKLNDMNYRPYTLDTFKSIVKKFYHEMGTSEQKDLINDLIRRKRPGTPVKASDLITHDEFVKIINNTSQIVERAYYEVLRFTGFRPGEAKSIKVKNVEIIEVNINDEIKKITYITCNKSKTYTRKIPIIESMPALWNVVNSLHDENMYIFPQRDDAYYRNYLLKTLHRAEIKRRIYFYLFRHTRCTEWLDMGVTEQILKHYMGWSNDSKQLTTYAHLTDIQLESHFLLKQVEYFNRIGMQKVNSD